MNRSAMYWKAASLLLAASGLLLLQPATAVATTVTWTGSASNLWSNNSNWSGDPTGNEAQIDGGLNLPVNLNGADSVNRLYLGTGGGTTGSLDIVTGADLTITTWYCIGVSGTGTVTQSGGNVASAANFTMADSDAAARGTYNLSGGSLILSGAGWRAVGARGIGEVTVSGSGTTFTVGSSEGRAFNIGGMYLGAGSYLGNGTSTFTQNGGTVNIQSSLSGLYLGVASAATGIYNLNGGTLNLACDIVNQPGTGKLNVNGGTLNFTGTSIDVDTLNVGTAGGVTGQLTVAAGKTITAGNMNVGQLFSGSGATHGIVSQTGGLLHTTGNLVLGWNTTDTVEYTISGASSSLDIDGYWEARFGAVTFTQNDGLVDVAGLFWLAEGSTGNATYNLNKGTLNIGGDLRVGASSNGIGLFNLAGGTATANDLLFSGSALSKLAITGGALRVRQSNYSLTDAQNDITAGKITSPDMLTVTTVNVGGNNYTQITWGPTEFLATTNNRWVVGSNWNTTSVPGTGATALVRQNRTAVIDASATGIKDLWVSDSASSAGTVEVAPTGSLALSGRFVFGMGGGTGNLNLAGGSLTAAGASYLGGSNDSGAGNAVVSHTGGTLDVNNNLYLGYNVGDTASYTLSGTGSLLEANEIIARSGNVTITQTGGTIHTGRLRLAQTNGTATYNLQGGLFDQDSTAFPISDGSGHERVYVGGVNQANSHGIVNQTGGTFNVDQVLFVGFGNSDRGEYTISAGELHVGTWLSLRYGTGTFTQSGGLVNAGSGLQVGEGGIGTPSIYTMTGGTLSVGGSGLLLGRTSGDPDPSGSDGVFNLFGGLATLNELLIGTNSADVLNMKLGGTLHVLQANYSLADGLADIAAGKIFSADGSRLLVNSVTVGGTLYTEITAVPEPGTLVLLALGGLGLLVSVRRRK